MLKHLFVTFQKNWNWQHGISLRRWRRIQSRTVWLLQPLNRRKPVVACPPSLQKPSRWGACAWHFAHESLFDAPGNKTLHRSRLPPPRPPNLIIIDFFVLVIMNLVPFTLLFIARRCLSHSVGEHLEATSETPPALTDREMPVWTWSLFDTVRWHSYSFWRGAAVSRPPGSLPQDLMSVAKRPRSTREIRIWSYRPSLARAPCAEMEQKPQRLTMSDVLVVKATTVQS